MNYSGALVALGVLSACGGGTAVAPSNSALNVSYVGRTLSVNGRLVTAARANPNRPSHYSPVVPARQRTAIHEYIINDYTTYAAIFHWPKNDKQVGMINNVGGQGCTNVLYGYGKKTFWIVAGLQQITEYIVPQKPVKTLSVATGQPSSCAMDTSGDLAVGNLANGQVVIFKNATGTGTVYNTSLTSEYFDGYDPKGNLFADGFDSSGFELIELAKGSSAFRQVTTSNNVGFPGSVQWDGTYLTVTDQSNNDIYRYTVSGDKATLQNTISLSGASDCAQNWIGKGVVFCADADNGQGEVFKYPAGGSAIAILGNGSFPLPLGVVAAKR
jgi:hypothetical protein